VWVVLGAKDVVDVFIYARCELGKYLQVLLVVS